MYLLYFIFAIIPFLFSHFLGEDFLQWIQGFFYENFQVFLPNIFFERAKVAFFLIVTIFLFLNLFRNAFQKGFRKKSLNFFKKYWIIWSVLIFLPWIAFWCFQGNFFTFLLGNSEKIHGFLWYFSLGFFLVFLHIFLKKSQKFLIFLVGIAVLVSLLTIGEFLMQKYIFLPQDIKISWQYFRPILSFWNPNYLAGFLFLHLPFLRNFKSFPLKIFLGTLLGTAIFMTGSLTAILLMSLYFLFCIFEYFAVAKKYFFIFCILLFSFWFFLIPSEKKLSFESRIILQKNILQNIKFPEILIGNGVGSVERFFENPRSGEIQKYFPQEMTIDSSHNIFVDFLYEFGMIWCGIIVYLFYKNWKYFSKISRENTILFFWFFTFNIITTAPALIFLFSLYYGFWKSTWHHRSTSPRKRSKNWI